MKNDIKKENRNALKKFLLVMLAAGIVGGVFGFLAGFAAYHTLGERMVDTLNTFLAAIAPWGIPATSVVLLGAAWWQYRGAKKQCAFWDGEEENVVDMAEGQLNGVLLLTTIQILLNFFFFAAAVVYWEPGTLTILAVIGMFLASILAIILIQQRVVDLERQLNPEKQGSIYDLKFKKKWFNSCDEAEQKQIGQAAYKAYNTVNAICPILWGVLILLGFFFDISLLPVFIVILVWGMLNISYIVECIRMRRRPLP